jgi:hypothetical protein
MQAIVLRSDVTVELVKHAASDAHVIWAARVSTIGEQSRAEIDAEPDRSAGLINFLMRDRHGTPFEHSSMTFYVQAPIFVFRHAPSQAPASSGCPGVTVMTSGGPPHRARNGHALNELTRAAGSPRAGAGKILPRAA